MESPWGTCPWGGHLIKFTLKSISVEDAPLKTGNILVRCENRSGDPGWWSRWSCARGQLDPGCAAKNTRLMICDSWTSYRTHPPKRLDVWWCFSMLVVRSKGQTLSQIEASTFLEIGVALGGTFLSHFFQIREVCGTSLRIITLHV